MEKVVENVVAEQLSHFYKINNKFHKSQIDIRKFCLDIDVVALLIYKV